MAKKSKDELLNSIDILELDDDTKIALLEDISDSFVDNSEEIEGLKTEIEGLKKKYIDRFMGRNETEQTEEVEETKEETEAQEPTVEEEKEKIDIKEI